MIYYFISFFICYILYLKLEKYSSVHLVQYMRSSFRLFSMILLLIFSVTSKQLICWNGNIYITGFWTNQLLFFKLQIYFFLILKIKIACMFSHSYKNNNLMMIEYLVLTSIIVTFIYLMRRMSNVGINKKLKRQYIIISIDMIPDYWIWVMW